ncbi:uncharacterized protein KIAA0408 homolog [Eublepharis macularius]|uniref:Uncharacterized protein KIAA0408 homolog n=1 Tax=Eublepharis macularius TaxID=481883 RepID=A0AA97LJP7_EUBMA|nr:uncharacterized protein KIAA0408 homolog [Eublepharis macularius]
MDLQAQLESRTERNWNKEKMELLERFDNERKEWECQWKVMQKKIEELYQEVKLRRESNMNAFDNKAIHSKTRQQFVHSPTSEWSDTPGLNCCSQDKESLLTKAENESKDTKNKRKNRVFVKDNLVFENYKEAEDCPDLKTTKNYTQDLSIALKELAKVSEDLCSYQEEIRKKSNHRRKKFLPSTEESAEDKTTLIMLEMNHMCNSDPQTALIAFETEKQNNRKNLMGINRCLKESACGVEQTDVLPWQRNEAPPVPPRSTSRHLTSSLSAAVHVSEVLAKDSGHRNHCKTKECQNSNTSINPSVSKLCDAPGPPASEWKSVSGPAVATTVPTEKKDLSTECKLSVGFCHNTWTCKASKIGNFAKNDSVKHSVQKSSSDGNMMSQKEHPESQSIVCYTSDFYTPVCGTLGDSGYGTGKTQRNETLEAKIDEFNRTVFHTDKGQKCPPNNQMLPRQSGDSNSTSILQERMKNRTEKNADLTDVLNPKLSLRKEEKPSNPSKNIKVIGQQKQVNGLLSSYQHMLHEHDWRPSNLSGRPRSADSRSNYGVVEKLLKNYEKSASLCNSKFHKEKWAQSNSAFAGGNCEAVGHYFEMLQADLGKQELQKNSARHVGLYTKQGREKQKFPEVSVPVKQSTGKGFSRPARPANRRLPSRWASRSPSAPPAVRGTALN